MKKGRTEIHIHTTHICNVYIYIYIYIPFSPFKFPQRLFFSPLLPLLFPAIQSFRPSFLPSFLSTAKERDDLEHVLQRSFFCGPLFCERRRHRGDCLLVGNRGSGKGKWQRTERQVLLPPDCALFAFPSRARDPY